MIIGDRPYPVIAPVSSILLQITPPRDPDGCPIDKTLGCISVPFLSSLISVQQLAKLTAHSFFNHPLALPLVGICSFHPPPLRHPWL